MIPESGRSDGSVILFIMNIHKGGKWRTHIAAQHALSAIAA